MQVEEQTVSLDTLGQGAAIEKFHDELTKVLENILDPNTKPTAKRGVILRVIFKPDEDRSFAHAVIETESKLAPNKPVGTAIYIGRLGGQAIATERDNRQMKLPESENVLAMKGGAQ